MPSTAPRSPGRTWRTTSRRTRAFTSATAWPRRPSRTSTCAKQRARAVAFTTARAQVQVLAISLQRGRSLVRLDLVVVERPRALRSKAVEALPHVGEGHVVLHDELVDHGARRVEQVGRLVV